MTKDRFGIPAYLTDGALPDDFYSLLGRIIAVEASIERLVASLHQMATAAATITYVAKDNRSLIEDTRAATATLQRGLEQAGGDEGVGAVLAGVHAFLDRAGSLLGNRNAYVHSAWFLDKTHPGGFMGLRFPTKDPNKGKDGQAVTTTILQHPARSLTDLKSDLSDLIDVDASGREAIASWNTNGVRIVWRRE